MRDNEVAAVRLERESAGASLFLGAERLLQDLHQSRADTQAGSPEVHLIVPQCDLLRRFMPFAGRRFGALRPPM